MRAAALALAALLAGAPSGAREVWRSGDRVIEVAGSIREVLTTTNGTDVDDFSELIASGVDPACRDVAQFADCSAFDLVGDKDVWTSLTRARVTIDARAGTHWSASLSYDHEWRAGTLDTFESTFAEPSRTLLDLEDDILDPDDDHFRWRHRLYRGWVRYEGQHVHVTVGRQRIAWGTGRLWNPIDRLSAIGPLAIEGDEFAGIDAIEARWMWSGFAYLQLVAAPGPNPSESRYALRAHGVVLDKDVSFVAGFFEKAFAVGADFAGNLGDAAWRLEAIWTDPTRDVWLLDEPAPGELPEFWQVVASIDTTLDIGPGLYVLAEHLYDGNALGFGQGRAGPLLPLFGASGDPAVPASVAPAPIGPERFAGSRVVSLAEHTTGLQVGADITPALRLDLLVLYDWNGSSAAFSPIVAYTGWNNFELSVGAQLFAGKRLSQFGAQQATGYALIEWFF